MAAGASASDVSSRHGLTLPVADVRGGAAAVAGAGLAILGNAVVMAVPPAVATGLVSYPLSPGQFGWGQVFFALTQALMAYGVFRLVRSGVARPRRWVTLAGALAVTGYAITVPGELVLIAVAGAASDSSAANTASTVFGVGLLIADIGLIGYGVAAVRDGVWPRVWAVLPAILGAFQIVVVTPVALSAGFATPLTFVVITVADLLMIAIGLQFARGASSTSA